MCYKKFKNKLKLIKKEYTNKLNPIKEKCKEFIGLSVRIPHGEYEGRWGKLTDIFINDKGELYGLIRPYRLKGDKKKLGEFLWERNDTRTFWKLSDVKEIKIEEKR